MSTLQKSPTIYFAPPAANSVNLQEATSGPEAVFEVLCPIDLRASKGINVELAHLEAMVKSYDPKVEEAALNFDHAHGGPAHGFAKSVWMEGGRLWARLG